MRACDGESSEGLPSPWAGGRAPPAQQERKGGYLRAGARLRGPLLPSPVQGRPRLP